MNDISPKSKQSEIGGEEKEKEEKEEVEEKQERLEERKKQIREEGVKFKRKVEDQEEVEIKKLKEKDVEETLEVMRKCAFEVTEEEVSKIIGYGKSFGVTVHRIIVGVGLGWPAKLDKENMTITDGKANALYLEDPAVLLAYEGKGIRRILLKEREEEARKSDYKYVISYLEEDIPKPNIKEYIREGGNQLEKLFLSEGYNFHRTERGILAFKELSNI